MSEFAQVPQRETYPLVSSDDTLVMVFRDHITSAAQPILYIKALTQSEVRVDSAPDFDRKIGFSVNNFSVGTGDTLTVTVDGTPSVLTEGVDFTAATSNDATAASIEAAVLLVSGVTALRVGNLVQVIPDAGTNTVVLATGDVNAWSTFGQTVVGTPTTLVTQETTSITLPVGAFNPLNKVSILHVLSGRVSVDLRSPVQVRTYFEMPETLRATTGQPGGWPTSRLP